MATKHRAPLREKLEAVTRIAADIPDKLRHC